MPSACLHTDFPAVGSELPSALRLYIGTVQKQLRHIHENERTGKDAFNRKYVKYMSPSLVVDELELDTFKDNRVQLARPTDDPADCASTVNNKNKLVGIRS